ncbi:MAG: DNA polymerase/3'-5' exonuclease PolX [bacterium]|nr:DNA polymerase/3'-5' exonuclease PolX [bacterium]
MSFSVSNKEAAKMLEEIGIMLELLGENPFKVRAHYSASRILENLDSPFVSLVENESLSNIKGIGKGMNEKLTELANTGKMSEYYKLKDSIPPGLWDILKIPGLGPKKVRDIFKKLDITTIGELEYACRENRLVTLEGFGQRSQEKTLEGIEFLKKVRDQYHIHNALNLAVNFSEVLSDFPEIKQVEAVGEIRRHCEVINIIELSICTEKQDTDNIISRIKELADITEVIEQNEYCIRLRHADGFIIKLILSTESDYPAVIFQSTGADGHIESAFSFKLDKKPEYSKSGILCDPAIAGSRDEIEIYKALGMTYIPPELRENKGEIEASAENSLPDLICDKDIKGILHVHTTYSDGINTIEEMVGSCMEMGYSYLGICDHSRSAFYANGLSTDRVKQQHDEIDELREKFPCFSIFKGIESDILIDGSLDYPDNILESFDFIVASVHSKLSMPKDEAQIRLENAVRNPYTTILGHPTGRLLLARKGYELDMERLLETASESNVVIELNANPFRLDLDWRYCRTAKELGVRIAVNPDAHTIQGLEDTKYGIGIARKGWLSREDVLNCLSSEEIGSFFHDRKISISK